MKLYNFLQTFSLMLLCSTLVHAYKLPKPDEKQCTIDEIYRFDCHPENGATQDICESRGCCWIPKGNKYASGNVPSCFYPENYPGYHVVNNSQTPDGYTVYLARDTPSYYPNDVNLVRADIKTISTTHIHLKVYDANNPRYEVPYFNDIKSDDKMNHENSDIDLVIEHPLNIKIIRKSTRDVIYHIPNNFLFTDQFIQISTLLPSKYIYGLGERKESFLRSVNWNSFTMFTADQQPRIDSNLYGSHPYFLSVSETGKSLGMVLINSNAMDVVLQPAPAITFRVLGGILDFHVFTGETPSEVNDQYIKFIGTPMIPPFWGLGFQLCRWGYNSSDRTREIWEQTRKARIPYDVQWNDDDYMDQQRDFTLDKNKFNGLPQLVKDIHDAGMHYVMMLDPGLDYTIEPNTYPPFDEGVKQDIFIKDADDKLLIGQVWSPNGAVYPDFTNPKTTEFWTQQLSKFHEVIPFDGLWTDMNEPSNFVNGSKSGCPASRYENPPYLPNVNGGLLRYKTLCMTAKQNLSIHYNVHNLYGFTEAIATNKALKQIRNKRPFIISRSTFLGQGHYSGHWSGDNSATWEDLQASIPAILDFNMFGIPLVGADICGFYGDTNIELCARWMELGAFYPFSRNHNSLNAKDQDPVSLGPDVVKSAKNALFIRYRLLPYLYTLFYRASVFGETVARSLLFEFPTDVKTFSIDSQFLWGSAVMILPVLEQGKTVKEAYFPEGTWYVLADERRIDSHGGTTESLNAPLGEINIAYRSGHIVPHLSIEKLDYVTTTASRKEKFVLMVYFDDKQTASGEVFWDDGESIDTYENGKYNLLAFTAEKGELKSQVTHYGAPEEPMILGRAGIFGIKEGPSNVFINGKPYTDFHYDANSQLLEIEQMSYSMAETITITWQ